MKEFLQKNRTITVLFLIIFALISRLAPHPANVTPLTAIALFSAAYIGRKSIAMLVPIAGFFISDMVLSQTISGYNYGIINPIMYGTILLITAFAFFLRKRVTPLRTLSAVLGSSLLFFLITNFAVWFIWDMYPKNISGLISCYIAAVPFFRNMLAGDIFYTGLLFGAFAMVTHYSEADSTVQNGA